MNEVIKVENGIAILEPEIADQIESFERKVKEIKAKEDALREAILKEMEAKEVKSIKSESLVITYKAPYEKETFDSKAFRKENPDLYDKYVNIGTVKSSIAIKVNAWT